MNSPPLLVCWLRLFGLFSPLTAMLASMKVRFVTGRVRVRLDDLELAALERGETLQVAAPWTGGGWHLELDPQQAVTSGTAGHLCIGLQEHLPDLVAAEEGIEFVWQGLKVSVQKDFGPQHLE